jgi:signal transduction histidine kinase
LIVVQQVHPLAFRAPTLRAIIETEITLCALVAAFLFGLSFLYRRRVRDLLLVGALVGAAVIDGVSYLLPAASTLQASGLVMGGPALGQLIMGGVIFAAVMVPPAARLGHGRRPLVLCVVAATAAAAVAELGSMLLLRHQLPPAGNVPPHGIGLAIQYPLGLTCALATGALLLGAAIRFAREVRGGSASAAMTLAAGLALFAAARFDYLTLPATGIGWVTAHEGLRIAGYALILAAALRQEATIRQAIADAAALRERRRIARDLHDGLAQDLAFIAAHGDRIALEAGEDHPLAIAARRALAVSRGAITDLSASEAPSARLALREVADELQLRFGVAVDVDAEDNELGSAAREDVVRIAREAIANAAHGQARNIAVSLTRSDGRFVLRVLDDGCGIRPSDVKSPRGFGLRSMSERATSLGGALTARRATNGGTELEVVFP